MKSSAESDPKNTLVDVWLVSLLTMRLVSGLLDESPVSIDEFALYGLISDLGPVTAAGLARWTGMSPTTLSSMLSRCERRGELQRLANPNDGRSTLLSLTDRGMEVYRAAVPGLLDAVARIDSHLDGSGHVRAALEQLDAALRALLGLDARPYVLASTDAPRAITYSGAPLDGRQRHEVLRYVDWIRERDA